MRQPNFAVLLAAYNGMQWIADQLQSILDQENVTVQIFISVDASSDHTLTWCHAIAAQNVRVTVLPSGHHFGGAAKNFFHLMREVNFQDFDYISFADQDDLWLTDKLSTAHEKIIAGNYAGYSGNVTAFWDDGREKLIDKAQQQRQYDFLFEAAGPGCSYVLQNNAAQLFKQFLLENWDTVNEISLHDWFIYAWFRANQLPWFIDATPKVLYRQHNHNQIGANQGMNAIYKRLKLIQSGWYHAEVNKIFHLISVRLHELQPELQSKPQSSDIISRSFIRRHFGQIRRRLRDRIFLLVLVMFRMY